MWTCHGCMQSWKHSHWLENHLAASPWCRARAVNAPPPPAGPAPAPASEDDSGDDAGFFGNSSGDDADMDYAGDAGHLPRASQDGSGDDTKSDGGSLDGGGGGGSSGGSDMSEDLPAGLSYRILHAQNQAAARGAAAAQRTEALPMSRRDVEMSLSLFRLEHELSHAAIDDLVELLRNNPEHLHRIRKSRTCYDDFSNEGRGAVDIVSLHVDVRRIGDPIPVPFKYETRTVEDALVDLFTRAIIKNQSSWPGSHKFREVYEDLGEGARGGRVYSDIYSSDWLRDTEIYFREVGLLKPDTADGMEYVVLPIEVFRDGAGDARHRRYAVVWGMMFAGLEFTVSQQTEARVLLSYFPSLGSEQHTKSDLDELRQRAEMIFINEFQSLQRRGLVFRSPIDGKLKVGIIAMPYPVLDNPEAHLFCGVLDAWNTRKLCTYCLALRADCGRPGYVCDQLRTVEGAEEVQRAVANLRGQGLNVSAVNMLKAESVQEAVNPWHARYIWGAGHVYLTPPEPMHSIDAGWLLNMVKHLLERLKVSSKPALRSKLDAGLRKMARALSHQATREWLFVAQHATTPANWNAQQVPLGLLQYMLYLRGGNFFADDAEEKKALVAVSKALRVRRDLANPTITDTEVQALAAGIEEAQQATVDAFSDLSKSRFANPKFHSLPQNAIDIPRLGVPRRRSAAPWEHFNRVAVKVPSNSTAQRFTDFVENLFTVTLTWLHLKLTLQNRHPPLPARVEDDREEAASGATAVVRQDFAIWPEVFHDKVYNLMSDLVDVGDCAMLLRDEFRLYAEGSSAPLLFRASPKRKTYCIDDEASWHDFAKVKFDEYNDAGEKTGTQVVTCRCMAFVEVRPRDDVANGPTTLYAVVECIDMSALRIDPVIGLKYGPMEMDGDVPAMQAVPTEAFENADACVRVQHKLRHMHGSKAFYWMLDALMKHEPKALC